MVTITHKILFPQDFGEHLARLGKDFFFCSPSLTSFCLKSFQLILSHSISMQSFLKIATLLATAISFAPWNCSPRTRPDITHGARRAIPAMSCRIFDGPTPSCLPNYHKKPITTIIVNAQHRPETVFSVPVMTTPNRLPANPNASSVPPPSGKPSVVTSPTSTVTHLNATFSTVPTQA